MFHVETKNINFKNKLFNGNEKFPTNSQYDILYNKEWGIAKTVFKKAKKSKNFIPTNEYLPHSKTKYTLISLLYSMIRRLMFSYKYKMMGKFLPKESKILDVGSGTGEFLLYMKKKRHDVYGLEPNKSARDISKNNGILPFENLKQAKGIKYKAITLWHVLEHLEDPIIAIRSFNKMLDKNGILILAVPNLESHDAVYYKKSWAAFDIPRHLWHFTPKGLLKIVEQEGFKQIKNFPLWFDTLYISYLSEKSRLNKFSIFFGLFKGVYFNLKSFKTKKYSSLTFVFRKTTP